MVDDQMETMLVSLVFYVDSIAIIDA
jgi:hypothetical protein